MRLTIPERDRGPFAALLQLNEAEYQGFLDALREAPATLNRRVLADFVAGRVSADAGDIREITRVLCTLVVVWDDASSLDDFVSELLRAAKALDSDEFEGVDWARATKWLTTLLLLDSLAVAGRGGYIAADHERYFCRGRVITDIRPVFRRDVGAGPAGAVIQHQLRISYHEEEQATTDFYVTLSAKSLAQLRNLIARAEEKEVQLAGMLKDWGVAVLEAGDHHDE